MTSHNSLNNTVVKTLNDYLDIIETIARIEYNRLANSHHLIDYTELVNIGAITVHLILSKNKNESFNNSYISTAIKWAIRNELRRRYKWYSFKKSPEDNKDSSANMTESERHQLRETIYETILSVEDLSCSDNPMQIKDHSHSPAEQLEFVELSKAIRKAIKTLPEREKIILESRFFKDKKIKDIAMDFNISSSRVSRVIQTSLDKIKLNLIEQGLV